MMLYHSCGYCFILVNWLLPHPPRLSTQYRKIWCFLLLLRASALTGATQNDAREEHSDEEGKDGEES